MFYLIFSFILTSFFAYFFIWFSGKKNIFDKPDGILKMQKHPTSHFGGAAMFLATTASFMLLAFFNPLESYNLFLFFASTTPFFLIGLIDDLINLTPSQKFIAQFLFGIVFIFINALFIKSIFIFLFLLFFILSVINAFNLIDVSDGLLGLTSVPFYLFFMIASFFSIIPLGFFLVKLLQIILGSLVAFLCFNKSPAKIYLGDAGAFFLASTALFFCVSVPIIFSKPFFLLLPFFFGIPLAELFWLIVIRLSIGKSIFLGSPHHFSIYLKKQGVDSSAVACFSALASVVLLFGVSLVFLKIIKLFYLFLFSFLGFILWSFLIYHPSMPVRKIFIYLNKDQG